MMRIPLLTRQYKGTTKGFEHGLPSGNLKNSYGRWFLRSKWCFSIAMLDYQRAFLGDSMNLMSPDGGRTRFLEVFGGLSMAILDKQESNMAGSTYLMAYF